VPFSGETPVEIAMKHLSQPPDPPSELRPEIPHDLDLVVLRALAKEPADRYRTAAEMDRDLELVARGEPVGQETASAATVVLAGGGALEPTAATRVARRNVEYGGDERYRAYDAAVRRERAWWPWLLALGALLALLTAGYFLYDNIQDQLAASEPVAVGDYEGLREVNAVNLIVQDGFEPKVSRRPNGSIAVGIVFDQDPGQGTRLAKGSIVTILVSTGKAKVKVPDVVGDRRDDAVETLTNAGLDPKVVEVPSDQDAGAVTAQDPRGGIVVVEGSTVRINVSTGPKPVAVPSVVGLLYDQAASQLQGAGFAVARRDVDNDQPKDVVIAQEPNGNSLAAKGSTVTLTVSKGPATTAVPDVTSADEGTARSTLEASGFKVRVVDQDTDDPTLDGIVISQEPSGNTQRKPGATVTIFVGRFVEPPPTETETETVPITP
jgi:beta-lactam-binding protein with PASTA domain